MGFLRANSGRLDLAEIHFLQMEIEIKKQEQLAKEILEIQEDKELSKAEKLIIIEMKKNNAKSTINTKSRWSQKIKNGERISMNF